MIYGHDRTIHRTGHVDVELNEDGEVVAVWFRCLMIPFKQHISDKNRSDSMQKAYEEGKIPSILAIEVEEQNG